MICTIALVAGFQSSSKLSAAYGVAVTATMLITTTLFFVVMREIWGWSRPVAGLLSGAFFPDRHPLFRREHQQNLSRRLVSIGHCAATFVVMITWEDGKEILRKKIRGLTPKLDKFKEILAKEHPQRIKGLAVFLTGSYDLVPAALMQNMKHNNILHSDVIFLTVGTQEIPRVSNFRKDRGRKTGRGYPPRHCTLRLHGTAKYEHHFCSIP